METITSSFERALSSSFPTYVKKIFLYARTFSATAEQYGPAREVSGKLIEISPIKWKVDTEGYGEWNASTCTLTFDNRDGAFYAGGEYFGADSEIHKSKICVHAGARGGGGIDETILVFEGYILRAPVYHPEEKIVTLSISSRLSLLEEISAQDICLNAEGQLLTAETRKIFYTRNGAVGEMRRVYRGAALASARPLTAGRDYDVSDIAVYDTPAKIILKEDLPETENLWADYRYYYQDKDLHWVAEQVADKAGAAERNIEELTFDTAVQNSFEESQATEFRGTFDATMVDAEGRVTIAGDFFASNINVVWRAENTPAGTSWTLSPDGVRLNGTNSSMASAYAAQSLAYGTWRWNMGIPTSSNLLSYYQFIASTSVRSTANGYAVGLTRVNEKISVGIYKVTGNTFTLLGTKAEFPISNQLVECELQVTRNTSGQFNVWFRHAGLPEWDERGILATDTTYRASAFQICSFSQNTDNRFIENIKINSVVALNTENVYPVGNYFTQEITPVQNFLQWESYIFEQETPPGVTTGSLWFRSKELPQNDWTAWIPIADLPGSKERIIQLRWASRCIDGITRPYLKKIFLVWRTQGASISVVNTSKMTCLDTLKELARMSSYEIGFDRKGVFLFRKRNTQTSGFYVLGGGEIYAVDTVLGGVDDVYNTINVNYGKFSEEISSVSEGESFPSSQDRYGVRIYELHSNAFLPQEGANISKPLGKMLYGYLKDAKKKVTLTARFMPQIELGDIVKLDYRSDGGAERFENVFWRVEGIELDLENWKTRLDLREVL